MIEKDDNLMLLAVFELDKAIDALEAAEREQKGLYNALDTVKSESNKIAYRLQQSGQYTTIDQVVRNNGLAALKSGDDDTLKELAFIYESRTALEEREVLVSQEIARYRGIVGQLSLQTVLTDMDTIRKVCIGHVRSEQKMNSTSSSAERSFYETLSNRIALPSKDQMNVKSMPLTIRIENLNFSGDYNGSVSSLGEYPEGNARWICSYNPCQSISKSLSSSCVAPLKVVSQSSANRLIGSVEALPPIYTVSSYDYSTPSQGIQLLDLNKLPMAQLASTDIATTTTIQLLDLSSEIKTAIPCSNLGRSVSICQKSVDLIHQATIASLVLSRMYSIEGCWFNGALNGLVHIKDADGHLLYEGEFRDGNMNGRCRIYYLGGAIAFEGQIIDNKRSGSGYMNHSNGCRMYVGEWRNNVFEGQGCLFNEEGQKILEGEFVDGFIEGKGNAFVDNHLDYYGTWRGGFREGQGIGYHESGNKKYEGAWLIDLRHGEGCLFYDSGGVKYRGEWGNNRPDGRGIFYDREGSKTFEGSFDHGDYHGQGCSYFAGSTSKCYDGMYLSGKRNGFGTEYFQHGIPKYRGYWSNDKRHGDGTEFTFTGQVNFDGLWVNDEKEVFVAANISEFSVTSSQSSPFHS